MPLTIAYSHLKDRKEKEDHKQQDQREDFQQIQEYKLSKSLSPSLPVKMFHFHQEVHGPDQHQDREYPVQRLPSQAGIEVIQQKEDQHEDKAEHIVVEGKHSMVAVVKIPAPYIQQF